MSAAIFELLSNCLALLFIGLTIKIMDDSLDNPPGTEEDSGLSGAAGQGLLPYTLLLFAGGVVLNYPWTVSLFLAAYAVGMAHSLTEFLPSGLTGWQESTLALVLGVAALGGWEMVGSLLLMLCIQLVDDVFDRQRDTRQSLNNLARRFGLVEASLSAVLLLLLASLLSLPKAVLAVGLSRLIAYCFDRRQRVREGEIGL